MDIKKVTIDLESTKFFTTGQNEHVIVTVMVRSWDAPDFAFKQQCPLDSFETTFDRIMEIGRRSILAEVERIKKDQLPYEEKLIQSLEAMKKRNETGDRGVRNG